jgi:hypothetical protein
VNLWFLKVTSPIKDELIMPHSYGGAPPSAA